MRVELLSGLLNTFMNLLSLGSNIKFKILKYEQTGECLLLL